MAWAKLEWSRDLVPAPTYIAPASLKRLANSRTPDLHAVVTYRRISSITARQSGRDIEIHDGERLAIARAITECLVGRLPMRWTYRHAAACRIELLLIQLIRRRCLVGPH